jgi:hypothetical protein
MWDCVQASLQRREYQDFCGPDMQHAIGTLAHCALCIVHHAAEAIHRG